MQAPQQETVIDKEKVQQILSQFQLPQGIVSIETTYGFDHTGDPAVYLLFHLDKSVRPTTKAVRPISHFASKVVAALYHAQIGGFAYSRLKAA